MHRTLTTLVAITMALSCSAQDTLHFDYWIEQTDHDELFNSPAVITIEESAVTVRTQHEYYSRFIVADGFSRATGERVLFFANCDKIRFCKKLGVIDGVFVSHRGRTVYFGKDPNADKTRGWTNKTKN